MGAAPESKPVLPSGFILIPSICCFPWHKQTFLFLALFLYLPPGSALPQEYMASLPSILGTSAVQPRQLPVSLPAVGSCMDFIFNPAEQTPLGWRQQRRAAACMVPIDLAAPRVSPCAAAAGI